VQTVIITKQLSCRQMHSDYITIFLENNVIKIKMFDVTSNIHHHDVCNCRHIFHTKFTDVCIYYHIEFHSSGHHKKHAQPPSCLTSYTRMIFNFANSIVIHHFRKYTHSRCYFLITPASQTPHCLPWKLKSTI
jgi:hypothetical protein